MHKKPRTASLWAAFLCGLAVLPGMALAADSFEVQRPRRSMAVPARIGTDVSGRAWTAADLRGKAVLLNFWASWCEPCRAEMPSLQALQAQHSEHIVVLAINYKEAPDAVQRFVQRQGWTLPIVTDPDGALARRWGIGIFPSSVLIDARGRVQAVVQGEVDWQAQQGAAWMQRWLGAAR